MYVLLVMLCAKDVSFKYSKKKKKGKKNTQNMCVQDTHTVLHLIYVY